MADWGRSLATQTREYKHSFSSVRTLGENSARVLDTWAGSMLSSVYRGFRHVQTISWNTHGYMSGWGPDCRSLICSGSAPPPPPSVPLSLFLYLALFFCTPPPSLSLSLSISSSLLLLSLAHCPPQTQRRSSETEAKVVSHRTRTVSTTELLLP